MSPSEGLPINLIFGAHNFNLQTMVWFQLLLLALNALFLGFGDRAFYERLFYHC